MATGVTERVYLAGPCASGGGSAEFRFLQNQALAISRRLLRLRRSDHVWDRLIRTFRLDGL